MFTNSAETRYAPIEGDALAVAAALKIPVYAKRKQKSLRYSFKMIYIPGVKQRATAYQWLSRHPTNAAVQLDDVATVIFPAQDGAVLSTAVTTLYSPEVRSVTWERLRTANASDQDMHNLHELIENDNPQ